MDWSEPIADYIDALTTVEINPAFLKRLVGLIDFTRLQENDTEANVITFFEKAITTIGPVAAVCVYPAFVRLAVATFSATSIRVATVANFPKGTASLESVLIEINQALEEGAQEIDMVFPYQTYLAGESPRVHEFVYACKAACGHSVLLKVILETGALLDSAMITGACRTVLSAGADFVKTSTGKIPIGATLEAAATLLLVIKQMSPELKRRVGLKVSGGIRTVSQAAQYIELADRIMGREWVSPLTFRIGASQLLDEVIAILTG